MRPLILMLFTGTLFLGITGCAANSEYYGRDLTVPSYVAYLGGTGGTPSYSSPEFVDTAN